MVLAFRAYPSADAFQSLARQAEFIDSVWSIPVEPDALDPRGQREPV